MPKSSIWRKDDELLRKAEISLLVDSATHHQFHELGDTFEAICEHEVCLLLRIMNLQI